MHMLLKKIIHAIREVTAIVETEVGMGEIVVVHNNPPATGIDAEDAVGDKVTNESHSCTVVCCSLRFGLLAWVKKRREKK